MKKLAIGVLLSAIFAISVADAQSPPGPAVATTVAPSVVISGTPNVAVTNTPNVAVTNTPTVNVATGQQVSDTVYPLNAIPVFNSSGVVANVTSTATLPATSGKTTYITGFDITAAGATAAACTAATVSNVTANMGYVYCVPAGAGTVQSTTLSVRFAPALPATATNTTIAVSLPGVGAGSTGQVVNAYGFQQ